MFDLDGYLQRVGLGGNGSPGAAEIHTAHVRSIPFENLDPHGGRPISLAVEDLERKLVGERRGGYCFEQNLLLKYALEALGMEVDLVLARVRVGLERGVKRPRTHLVLRVGSGRDSLLADAGFGRGTLLEPIPFAPGEVHDQAGWKFRLVQDGSELVLQTLEDDTWNDLYGFIPEPVPLVDVEVSNWFTSTHPRSPFVTGLVVSLQGPEGTRLTLSDWDELALTEQTPAASSVTPIDREAVPGLLAERFGLPGFRLNEDGRIVRDWPVSA